MTEGDRTSKSYASSSAAALDRMLILRGAALQSLVALCERNTLSTYNKRYAFNRLKVNAFGSQAHVGVPEDGTSLRFSQGQLRLLRQEQLMLMAENERLVYELQEVRRCRSSGQFRPSQPRSIPEFRESKLSKAIDMTLSGGRDSRLSAARIGFLSAMISRLRYKVLSAALRALFRNSLRSVRSGPSHTSVYYSRDQMRTPCMVMENIIRSMVHRTKRMTLYMLKRVASDRAMPPRRSVGFSDATRPCVGLPQGDSRPSVDMTSLYMPGPHTSYQQQLPSVRRYLN
uniref:Uncharacterized protein n=1 Tax=Babesia bovis TaxID=5865 RepID=S6B9D1_BABBO|nr:hypothetical protein [Babesia bovis]